MQDYLPEITFASIFSVFLLFYWFQNAGQKRDIIEKRLKIGKYQASEKTLENGLFNLFRKIWKYVSPGKEDEIRKIRQELVFAGYRDSRAIYYYAGIRAGASLICACISAFWFILSDHVRAMHMAFFACFIVIGGNFPRQIVRYRIKRRQQAIFRELPDMLDMLIICIEAGLGFEMALFRVSRELGNMAPVLSKEFALYFFETRGGISRRQALTHMKERNPSEPLRGVIDVILQSVQFGTDLVYALGVHSESMRNKRQYIAEEKAAKIAPKLVLPLIGFILPALMIIVLGPAIVNLSRNFLR